MPSDLAGIAVILVSFALTFIVARAIAAWWRSRQRDRQEQQARAGETRQVRRARERRGRK